jgi:hypothetical protein
MAATELAQFEEFVITHSTASTFAAPTTIARVSSFNVNDTFDVQGIDDFDAAAATIIDQVLGGRTVNLTFDANLVPSDAGFQALHDDYKDATYCYLGFTLADTKDTTTTWTLRFGGYLSQRSITGSKPVATVNWQFVASEVISDQVA